MVLNDKYLSSAQSALHRLSPTPEARRSRAPTPRERDYLDAVEGLYGPGSKPRRDTLYALAMERLVRAHHGDLEAKTFYSLALLGLNHGVRGTVTYLHTAPWADTMLMSTPAP